MINLKNFSHTFFDEVAYFKHLTSTSLKAEQLIRTGQAQGNLLVIADTQSGGMGRNKRHWVSPEGGLWFTSAVFGLPLTSKLTLFTGITLHKALLRLYPSLKDSLMIKWPNDIYLDNRKVAGILASHLPRHRYHLIGIGINSNFTQFSESPDNNPITLKEFLNTDIDNDTILSTFFDLFAEELPSIIEANPDMDYLNKYSLLKDKHVILDTDFDRYQGKVINISSEGALLLEIKPGMIQPFLAGSVVEFS